MDMPRRLAALPFALLPVLSLLAAEAEPEPALIVLPYLQNPKPDAMTVMWETNVALPGTVEYGPTPELGKSAAAAKDGTMHEVTLTGLQAGTTYHYRVRSGGLTSPTYRFRTAPAPGTKKWRLVVYGDSRSNPAVHAKIAEGIRKAEPDFFVHTGDIVFNGRDHASWRKEFFVPLGDLLRSTPWISTLGNHELDSPNYFSYVSLPGNQRYYTFDFANAHFICLDSTNAVAAKRDPEQTAWLKERLKEKRTATWTFAAFHHTLYSANPIRAVSPLRAEWAPLLIDPANHVDAVLNGHDHFYARSYPIGPLGDKPGRGVPFITTAGGGAPSYRATKRDFIALEKEAFHFTVWDFDGDRVTVRVIDLTGAEIDRFELTKEDKPSADFCAAEVEDLREALRLAVAAPPRARVSDGGGDVDVE